MHRKRVRKWLAKCEKFLYFEIYSFFVLWAHQKYFTFVILLVVFILYCLGEKSHTSLSVSYWIFCEHWSIFQDWFQHSKHHQVKKYQHSTSTRFQIFLSLDKRSELSWKLMLWSLEVMRPQKKELKGLIVNNLFIKNSINVNYKFLSL